MNKVEGQTLRQDIQGNNIRVPRGFLKIGLTLIVLLGLLAGAVVAYIWFSGGTGQASSALTAPSLKVSPTGKLFRIVQNNSQVRFIINEMLIGKPNTVVGSTNQVAGEIMVDLTHPENTQLGVFRINVKTLQTDNEFRNRALRGQILLTTRPDFEFATFVPKKIEGMPESVAIGKKVFFQIVGDLTVRDVTREVTFDTAVTLTNPDRVEGSAQTNVRYKDFNITIPDAPGVVNVSNDVRLEIDFVAVPAGS